MNRLALAVSSAAVLALAGPAAAQNTADIMGDWTLHVNATGEGCPEEETLDFKVQQIAGRTLTFVADGDTERADYDPASKRFVFEVARDDGETGQVNGRFSRTGDVVRLDIDMAWDRCTATMVGVKPARTPAPAEAVPPPPPATTTAAAPATPAGPDMQTAATAPAGDGMMARLPLYGGVALAILLAGLAGGWVLGRGGGKRREGDSGHAGDGARHGRGDDGSDGADGGGGGGNGGS